MKINFLTHSKFNNFSKYQIKVDDKLSRGKAVTNPFKLRKMKKNGITQIIDLRNSSFVERPIERIFCKLLGIKYLNYKYKHRLNTLPEGDFFEKINDTITANKGKTYIHCQYGKRRTGICVAVYEKEVLKRGKDEIIRHLIRFGYKELQKGKSTTKLKKLQSIYNDFLEKYYPNEK